MTEKYSCPCGIGEKPCPDKDGRPLCALETCPACGDEFSPDIDDQERCEFCEANLHEQYQHTNH